MSKQLLLCNLLALIGRILRRSVYLYLLCSDWIRTKHSWTGKTIYWKQFVQGKNNISSGKHFKDTDKKESVWRSPFEFHLKLNFKNERKYMYMYMYISMSVHWPTNMHCIVTSCHITVKNPNHRLSIEIDDTDGQDASLSNYYTEVTRVLSVIYWVK